MPPPTGEGFDRTAAQLRGVLRLARSLASIDDEQTLFHMVVNTARSGTPHVSWPCGETTAIFTIAPRRGFGSRTSEPSAASS